MATTKAQQAKQQRRIQRKRKAAQRQKAQPSSASRGLQKKIAQNELFRNMTVIDSNKAEVKMSAVMLDFLAPYKQFATTRQAFEKLVTIGLVAWNLAMEEEAVQREEIDKTAEVFEAEDAADFRAIVAEMIERKQRHFAQYQRKIIEYHVTESADSFHLSVASTPE